MATEQRPGGPDGDLDHAALLDAADTLWAVLEATDDAVVSVAPDGTVTGWNPAATLIFGIGPVDAIGTPLVDLFPPERRAAEAEALARALRGHRIDHRPTEAVRPDGYLVALSVTLAPRHGPSGELVGVTLVARDVTEILDAQASLAEQRDRLREAEQLARFGMWSWDRATGILQCSEGLVDILGVTPGDAPETIEELACRIVPEERADVVAAMRSCAARGEAFAVEASVLRPDGRERRILLRGNVIRSGGGARIGMRGTCSDVTERHAIEQAIRLAYEREAQAAEELREADQVKDVFLSTVSHELRTPLAVIYGLADELRAGVTETEIAQAVERIHANAASMREMIDQLLDFTRIAADAAPFAPAPLAVRREALRQIATLRSLLDRHVVRVDVAADVVVEADAGALARILSNLLTNAARHTPEGGTVTVDAEVGIDEVTVSVVDTGPGVPAAERARVFERFVQLDPGRPGRRGTGLGLAIVRADVERHGGRVWIDAAPGGGAAFRFTLPRGVLG